MLTGETVRGAVDQVLQRKPSLEFERASRDMTRVLQLPRARE